MLSVCEPVKKAPHTLPFMNPTDTATAQETTQVGVLAGLHEPFTYKTQWIIDKYASEQDAQAGKAFEQSVVDGNMWTAPI